MPSSPRPKRAAFAALALGALLTLFATLAQVNDNSGVAESRFEALAARAADRVGNRLRTYEYGLRGARGAVLAAGAERIDRTIYRRYAQSRDVDREFPGVHGIGVIRRVAPTDEAGFVAAARREGTPDFTVMQLAPHPGDRFVIQFLEPLARNVEAVGLDVASEANRRAAAVASTRTGKAALSAPITLVQASGQHLRSFALMLPIFRDGLATDTPQARESASIGWSFASLVIDEVLKDFDFEGGEFSMVLRDVSAGAAHTFFASVGSDQPVAAGLTRRIAIPLYGRTWEAEVRATPRFVQALNLRDPRFVAAVGAMLSALLAGLAALYAQSAGRARQVHAEQARRYALVEASSDAIVGLTLDGRITDWNLGAERLFGLAADHARGQRFCDLVLPDVCADEDRSMIEAIVRGEAVHPFDTVRRHADGSLIDVSVAASPIVGPDGRLLGLSETLRDISEASRTKRRVLELNASLERQVLERTASLRASEALLDRAGHIAGVGGWELDLRRGKLTWSAQTYRIHEVPAGYEPTLDAAIDFYAPQSRPAIQQAVADAMASGGGWDLELPFVTAKGNARWVRAVGTAETENGQAVRLIGAFQDITARKDVEASLAYERHLMSSLLDTLPDQIYFKDRDSRFLRINPGLARRYGLGDPGQAIGKSDADFFTAEHARITAEVERRIMDSDTPVLDLEEQEFWPDRPPTWNLTTKMPLRDAEGQVIGTFGVSRDISARKRVESELLATSSMLRTVLESASEVSLIATSPDLTIRVFNAGAERLLGYGSDEVVGHATPVLIHDADEVQQRAAELSAQLGRRVEGADVFIEASTLRQPREWTYVRKDGGRITVSLVVTAMHTDAGDLIGFLGVAHDVTRQKQYEASLREAMQKSELASQAKSQFLANMSHEIRTPMNAVIGLSYLLGQTTLDRHQAEFLGKIRLASKALLEVINDVLDLSKIEAGELDVELAPFNLRALLLQQREVMAVQADARGIGFDLDVAPDLPVQLIGDAARLNQVLRNLLSNAIKFTDAGGVVLRVRTAANDAAGVRLRFEVEDSGIGIAPDVQQRLFMPFAQADASTTRRFGGTGLGLSIVKRLALLMGGEVGMQSTPGEGSVFHVELPFASAAREDTAWQHAASQRPVRHALLGVSVLVVDDNEINLDVARHILTGAGARVDVARNGREAFDAVAAQPQGFDVVLMDVQMPVLDGHQATRRIRNELGLATLPIIALTAGALTSERQYALEAGMNDFVSKPFEVQALVACLLRHVSRAAREPETDTVPASAGFAAAAAPWPEIDGIDTADVRERLGGDTALFRTMLERLIGESAEVADWATRSEHAADAGANDPAALSAHAACMHKLRGSAGTLGARLIHQLAGEAELACRDGDTRRAAGLTARLLGHLRDLHSRSAKARAELARPSAPCITTEDIEVDPRSRLDLVDLLRRQSMSALDRFETLSPQLRRDLGNERYAAVRAHLDNLRFAEAANVLSEVEA